MNFKPRQRLSKATLGSSLVGDGLVRLRSTSIAMMAVVAAIGLVLVALISQMGWPTVLSGPIPAGPELGVVRNDPIAAPRAPARSEPSAQGGDRRAAVARPRGTPDDDPGSGLGSARQVQPDPAGSAPAPQPPPPTAPQPTAPREPAAVVTTPSPDGGQSPSKQRAAEEKPSKSRSARDKSDGRRGKSAGRRGRKSKAAVPPPVEAESVPPEDRSGEVGAEDGREGPGAKGGERGKRGRGAD